MPHASACSLGVLRCKCVFTLAVQSQEDSIQQHGWMQSTIDLLAVHALQDNLDGVAKGGWVTRALWTQQLQQCLRIHWRRNRCRAPPLHSIWIL